MAYSVEFALCDVVLIDRFNQVIKSFISKKEANIKQIQTLTKTRDTLLPKLMSGKLRVKE
jgi:type I restriction enzyme S subunit